MHSATKQLNGHADVLAGALVTARRDAVWERLAHDRAYRGAVLGPFEAWLLLRGMRTLYVRVPRSADSALRIAHWLVEQPTVRQVYYPGLPGHPGLGRRPHAHGRPGHLGAPTAPPVYTVFAARKKLEACVSVRVH